MDIAAWLRELGLERYQQAFWDNDVDAKVLPHLTAEDLKDIGITSVGHRRRLLAAIEALRAETAHPEQEEPSATTPPAAEPLREAERRQLTVLFCDLVGSTELSARLDPEDMGQVIRAYQTVCTEVVARWDGHVAKYMGDGVLTYFGWPQAHEDDAERALRAGLDLVETVAGLASPDGRPLAARVGIATGLVMVGDLVGEGGAQEQAVFGETPNLAARLQALAEPRQLVIAPTTRQLVGGLFELDDLGEHRLKGFAAPVQVWRVIGVSAAESRFEAVRGREPGPLVGREHELGLLLDRWRRAKDAEGQVVLLAGEAGIGKSRLLSALRECLGAGSCTVLSHGGSPFHTSSALYPVIGLLERAADLKRDDSSSTKAGKLEALLVKATDDLATAVPLVAALLGIEGGPRYPPLELTPERQKQRTLAVLMEQVAGYAARQPVLALFEDAHWFDPTTLELLDLLVERVRALPVLVLITHRPDFTPRWSGQAHVTQLSLSRLSRRDGAAIAVRITGGKALPADVLDQILARTEGVPLFVEELTKAVVESDLLADAGDHYVLDGPLPPLAIPTTLHDSMMARLDRLAPVKEIAQIGAVIGREFSHALLAALAERPEPDLNAALDQLADAELIFRRGTAPDAIYTFKHALLQDAAYQSLLKFKRQQLHARIAQVLEEQFPNAAESATELLAHHLTEAGLVEQAVAYWRCAGEQANRRFANEEAVAQLKRALALLATLPQTMERDREELEIRDALIPPLRMLYGYATTEMERCVERAGKLAARLGDERRQFSSGRVLRSVRLMRGSVADALEFDSATLRSVEARGGSEPAAATVKARYGFTLLWHGRFVDAKTYLVRSLDLSEAVDTHFGDAVSDSPAARRLYLGLVMAFLGQLDRSAAMANEGLVRARQLDDPRILLVTLSFAVHRSSLCRDVEATRALAEETVALAREQRARLWHSLGTFFLGWALAKGGRLHDGIAQMNLGSEGWRKTGARLHSTMWHGLLGDACLAAGDIVRARTNVDAALAHAKASGERYLEAELQRIDAACRRQEGKSSYEVEQTLLRAIDIALRQHARLSQIRATCDLARLWGEQGERRKARDLLAPVYDSFTEGFDTADLKDAKALLDELL